MTAADLRRYAVTRSLFAPTDLESAIRRLGYVQADPIRAPARAQDLILRHRVADYRIDDLERRYPELPLIEDTIYNYGFFCREVRDLLHPRLRSSHGQAFMQAHAGLRRKVLAYLRQQAEAHPRDIEAHCGDGARVNGWGGSSSASTLMLEGLHREGKLIVSRRDAGIKVYALAPPRGVAMTANARAEALVQLVVNLYAPMPLRSLMTFVRGMGRYRPGADFVQRVELLVRRGQLRREMIDGIAYVWPAAEAWHDDVDEGVHVGVRFLAPFDPIVWDRRRFTHLWGWDYRFEAYTPAAKRQRGYYALPLLWRDAVVGWANVSAAGQEKPRVEIGFAAPLPRGQKAAFNEALAVEKARFAAFLRPRAA